MPLDFETGITARFTCYGGKLTPTKSSHTWPKDFPRSEHTKSVFRTNDYTYTDNSQIQTAQI